MAQPGCSKEPHRIVPLKRKRNHHGEDLENVPPNKISSRTQGNRELSENSLHSETSTNNEELHSTELEREESVLDLECNGDSNQSSPSLPELPNCVLSTLENGCQGDSTPHSNKRQSKLDLLPLKRKCPLPSLPWGERTDVWRKMCEGDYKEKKDRDHKMFDNHPNLQPRMRAILLDWLNEVSEVYKLHRETFYLTVEYIDRYLTKTKDLPKSRLQLIGITCLFIAAKVEEVYPPKIGEFSYVTDGACTTEEILKEEMPILNVLSWNITPMTMNSWLNMYVQVNGEDRNVKRRLTCDSDSVTIENRGLAFVYPQYSSLEFTTCARIIDLAILHVDVNSFPYGLVAAAAMAHMFDKDLAVSVSGYSWDAIEPCYTWLEPFAAVINADDTVTVTRACSDGGEFMQGSGGLAVICPDINLDESHRLQVHNVTIDMFEKVIAELGEQSTVVIPSVEVPSTSQNPIQLYVPTPPQSNEKEAITPVNKKSPCMRHSEESATDELRSFT